MNGDPNCVRCGYVLTGLEGIARCPECGLEIDASLSRWELRRSDPFWVANLLYGATLGVVVQAGLLLVALLRIARALTPLMWAPVTSLDGAVYACSWASAMLLAGSETDPIPLDEPINVPRILRVAATAHLIARFLYIGSNGWPTTLKWVVFWCDAIAAMVAAVFYFLQVRRLGRRVPDAFIIRHSTFVLAAKVAGQVMTFWVPSLLILFPRSQARSNFEQVPGEILTWVACAYALALMLRFRKRLIPAAAEAKQHWLTRQTAAC